MKSLLFFLVIIFGQSLNEIKAAEQWASPAAEKRFICEKCGARFFDLCTLGIHMQLHGNEIECEKQIAGPEEHHACPECEFKLQRGLPVPISRHQLLDQSLTDDDFFSAPLLKQLDELFDHAVTRCIPNAKKIFTEKQPCDYCGKHPLVPQPQLKHLDDVEKTTCDSCACVFASYASMLKHRKNCSQRKCALCRHSERKQSDLKKHTARHYDPNALKTCDLCGRVLASHSGMLCHRIYCAKLRCKICGYSATDKVDLEYHTALHDDPHAFHCIHPGCNYVFNREVARNAHMQIKHPSIAVPTRAETSSIPPFACGEKLQPLGENSNSIFR